MLINCRLAALVALDKNDVEYLGTEFMAVSLNADLAKLFVKLNILKQMIKIFNINHKKKIIRFVLLTHFLQR